MEIQCPMCLTRNSLQVMEKGCTAYCSKCDTQLLKNEKHAVAKTLIFSGAALAMYFPAILLPVLSMEKFGIYSENTIISGCVELFKRGYWGIALVVFVASILVPLLKIIGMLYISAMYKSESHRLYNTKLYSIIHTIGPWSMLDVFLVAILIALVKLGDIANVSPEPGLAAFTAVVVLTLFASSSFDPRIIWSDRK